MSSIQLRDVPLYPRICDHSILSHKRDRIVQHGLNVSPLSIVDRIRPSRWAARRRQSWLGLKLKLRDGNLGDFVIDIVVKDVPWVGDVELRRFLLQWALVHLLCAYSRKRMWSR